MPSDDASQHEAPPTGRLPDTVRPERYDLRIAPDLATATFAGEVAVTLVVDRPTDVLTCNAAELQVGEAWVEAGGIRADGHVELDEAAEQLRVHLPEPLAAGGARLHVRFSGALNDKLRGFYRSSYVGADGAKRTVAVTQFEPTDARRAFPCWDEPAFKAIFGVTLDVADGLLAVSNGPELDRVPLDGGRVRIRFADTMPMSTYLVAFVVGPLEVTGPIDVDGTPMRIVHRPGQRDLAEFALEVGAFALRFYADYYGIAYPGDKLDMVAVPDFAFGAMENLGCVVYRETLLLVDPESATQSELVAVCDVIAHELAHMWFGDLVTMAWWNGIWLNEAFATFMEATCSAAFRPQWERWMHFARERSGAFDVDALATTRPIEYPVVSPADAEGMFDTLTYQKGSAVVRMLEQYLGPDAFRDGIRRYLQAHQYGNTDTGDLWDALEAETGEPVRATMDSWIFQGGFPLVRAERDGHRLCLSQERFRYGDGEADVRWRVPVVVRQGTTEQRLLLDGDRAEVPLCGADDQPVVANAGGHGFYRVAYAGNLRAALLDGLAALAPLELYALLDDTLGLFMRGDAGTIELADLLQRIAAQHVEDLSIWQLAASAVDAIDRAAADEERPAVSAWVRRLVSPLTSSLGDEVAETDDDRRRALRGLLLGLRGVHGDPAAIARAEDVFEQARRDPGAVDAELAAGALRAVAVTADAARFEAVLDRFRNGATPQEQVRHLYAAAAVTDPALFARYLDLLSTDDVRTQNLAFAYRAALRHREHGATAWAAIRDRWEAVRERLPFNMTHRMLEGVSELTDRALAEEVDAFVTEHPVPEAAKLIAQHVERMWVQVAVHEREAGRIASALPRA